MQTDKAQDEKKRMKELVLLISKLIMSVSLSCRIFRAIVIQCLAIQTDSHWHKNHKAGRDEYIADQKKAKMDGISMEDFKSDCGTPYVWARTSCSHDM